MRALTIKQPWASLIMRCGKDIENRDWRTNHRGLVAIHTSARMQRADIEDACSMMRGFIPKFSERIFTAEALKSPERYPVGCIVGVVEIVDCVTGSESPWFCGDFGFVLRNPVAFETPIPCRGALGLWEVAQPQLALMREQWKAARHALVPPPDPAKPHVPGSLADEVL